MSGAICAIVLITCKAGRVESASICSPPFISSSVVLLLLDTRINIGAIFSTIFADGSLVLSARGSCRSFACFPISARSDVWVRFQEPLCRGWEGMLSCIVLDTDLIRADFE